MSVENPHHALPALPLALPLKPQVNSVFDRKIPAGNVATLVYSWQKKRGIRKKV